ncbi:MAG: hypothetical protein ABIL25_05285 [candidate division WOR-3 bacterium]
MLGRTAANVKHRMSEKRNRTERCATSYAGAQAMALAWFVIR